MPIETWADMSTHMGTVALLRLGERARSLWSDARLMVVLAAVLFAAACLGWTYHSDSIDSLFLLLMVPVALCAFRFEVRAGVAAGLLAFAIAISWDLLDDFALQPLEYVEPAAVLLSLGGLAALSLGRRKQLEEKLSRYHELSLDLHCTASFEGYFTQVNPSFTRVLGFSAEELMRQPLLDFVHPDDREPTLAAIAEQTERGEAVFHFRNRYRTKEGAYRWLEWTSRPNESANELVAVARDVTDRKRLEEVEQTHKQLLEQAVHERTEELRQRNAELDDARLETLRRLALAAEYRDDNTHHHTERVGRTAALVAGALGLPEETVQLLRLAAPLHDVGKLGVSDSILLKPGRLTTHEFELMQDHVYAGAKLLSGSGSKVLRLGEEIALTHHERWDGTGYPRRLRGEEIPISGRIVALADVFDALTHERPYKHAWTLDEAVAEIRRLSGRQFDPRVVEAFDTLDHASLISHGEPPHLAIVA
jgi:PAS domain S-box-containing protein